MSKRRVYIFVLDNDGNFCITEDGTFIVIGYEEVEVGDPVPVRIMRGRYIPCDICKWHTYCVVPRGQHIRHYKEKPFKIIWECYDFESK